MKRFSLLLLILVSALACSTAASGQVSPQSPADTRTQQPASSSPAQPNLPKDASSQIETIEIREIGEAFSPKVITVKAGARVRFVLRNEDPEEHNLVSLSPQITFPSNEQAPGGKSTVDWVAPTQPGEYNAVCAFHSPGMALKIIVQ